ncbi:MAG: 50S ribosomal protein L3 N(5)-glutamine methyltransferase [Neisseriaceae bacterium]|nr:MAG: 50S ribosomal protein L3 N(5)-glutamine methyltransferase [Neisseriaceae bacterium]
MIDVLITVRDYIRYAVSEFRKNKLSFGHGTGNAYDEAVSLVLQTLNLPVTQLEPYLDARLLPEEKSLIIERIKMRVEKRIPLPYITKTAYLRGYEFYVDERTIVPRSYIAEIIQNNQLLPWIENNELVHNALDLCTGNGSLSIFLADNFLDANVVASDISTDALAVAAINLQKYHYDKVVQLEQSDMFSGLNKYLGKFDLIITNPPYVDDNRMEMLPKEYHAEPNISLHGGHDGLDFVETILTQAKYYLTQYGVLVVEMGDNARELEDSYPGLHVDWLETEGGDGFVFVVTRQELDRYFN